MKLYKSIKLYWTFPYGKKDAVYFVSRPFLYGFAVILKLKAVIYLS